MLFEDPLQPRTKKRKHDGVRYPCTQCEHTAPTRGNLKTHIAIKHEGYFCDQYNFVSTAAGFLQEHIQGTHEGVRFSCDQCNFVITALL